MSQQQQQEKQHLDRGRRAFTLVEIITVVVILVILIAIVVPMLAVAMRKGKNTRAAAYLASISTGLDAYRTDFGDYPRPTVNNTGFAVLGKALVSPGPAGAFPPPSIPTPALAGTIASVGTPGQPGYAEYVAVGVPLGAGGFGTTTTPPSPEWASFWVSDGKDGPGFRVRAGSKTYGPYLSPEKFRMRGLAILDTNDNPILYFPARPQKPAPDPATNEWPMIQPNTNALYNSSHNLAFFLRPGETIGVNAANAQKRLEAILITGDNDYDDGFVGATESAATTAPFLLWSAGADGNFGVTYAGTDPTRNEIRKCDDVTNFTTGQ